MSAPAYLTGDKKAIQDFLDRFDVFLFDCDGVLWSGDHLFPGTVETLELLRSKGLRIVPDQHGSVLPGKQTIFVTNNSTKSRAEYRKKLTGLGIPCTVEEIFGSAYSSAVYISRILQLPANKKKVFILGEAGIEAELASENVPFLGGSDPKYRRDITPEDYRLIASSDPSLIDPEVGVVLCGLDFHVNYLKLSLGFHYVRFHGAQFLATNIDSTLPNSRTFFPGAGATTTAPLAKALGTEPVALGKPSQAMMDAIEGKFHFDRARTCMVGDRMNTDIQFGIKGKLGGTLAVLTGVSTKEEFTTGDMRPSAYVDTLSDLLEGA